MTDASLYCFTVKSVKGFMKQVLVFRIDYYFRTKPGTPKIKPVTMVIRTADVIQRFRPRKEKFEKCW